MNDVDSYIDTLNNILGTAAEWPEDQTGQWQLRAEYGHYYVAVVCNEHGGITRMASGTLRECSIYIRGVLAGIHAARTEGVS